MQHTATYSPEDNKLRLYPGYRLDEDEYARVKAAGFKWAPKQELFVAPAWTPGREDLLIEMCGEIEDEDTSLVERAAAKADRLAETVRAGVQVVSVPNLFPTPTAVTEELAQLSDIGPGHDILEPSAGTGAILDSCFHLNGDGRLVAVEINPSLVDSLRVRYPLADVRCADFLECNRDLGTFDRIVMNPPFDHGSDVRHIQHARKFSKPGGRLVAICAAGPVQRDALEPVCSEWIDLPQGTFKEQGTNVHTAIVVIDAD